MPPTGNENILHSVIVRYWRGADGELRGQVINPITDRIITFASISGLQEILSQVVQDLPNVGGESEYGGDLK